MDLLSGRQRGASPSQGGSSQQIILLNYTLVYVCYFLISHSVDGESARVSSSLSLGYLAECGNGRIKHFDDIDGNYDVEQKLNGIFGVEGEKHTE